MICSNEMSIMAVALDVEKIGLDVPTQEVYPSFMDRYFTPRYVLDVHSKGDDICVLFHSNRSCLIALAPSHPVLAKGIKITKVDFKASESEEDIVHKRHKHRNESTNRLDNRVSGKKKKGAQVLHKMSLLCKVELEDGSVYSVRSGIPGLLVEINEQLIENPNLIMEKPSSEGYIAIMLPRTLESDRLRDNLMTPEQYQKALEERSTQVPQETALKMELDQDSSQDLSKVEHNGKALVAVTQLEEVRDSTAEPVKVEHAKTNPDIIAKMDENHTQQ